MEKLKKQNLKTRLLLGMLVIIVASSLITNAVVGINMLRTHNYIVESDKKLSETVEDTSSTYMQGEVTKNLLDTALLNANKADANFEQFKEAVEMLRADAEYLYAHESEFGRVQIAPPDPANDGELSLHITYSKETDSNSAAIKDEAGLLGNDAQTLLNVHAGNPSMAACYFATESGIFIEADYAAAAKCDENGIPQNYEAKERPWYQGTVKAGETYFTNIVRESTGKRVGMMCGSPIFYNGELKGVACAGIYLDDLKEMVESVDIGEGGIAIIFNNNGQLVYTSESEGEFAVTDENAGKDWRQDENEEFAKLVIDGAMGEKGNKTLKLGDKSYCAAYAPIETLGWSFVVMLPEEEVYASTNNLINQLSAESETTELAVANSFMSLVFILGVVAVVMILLSLLGAVLLANDIARPIQLLTKKVAAVEGDNLEFEWDLDVGTETQKLAESFQALTTRMKGYITEVTEVTAERERLGTELGIATRIQASMLPNAFPPFPDRKEFDIYASMHPAKEVGGDFYDFFFIDSDHLALVIADVSDKGVPAAMFMMVSKTMIQNRTLVGGTPGEILTFVNDQIVAKNDASMFVTVWFAILTVSTGEVIATNAGHEYPAIRRADGKYEYLKDKHGLPLGVMEGSEYKDYTFNLNVGDSIYVYTDGVTEAINTKEEFWGMDNLLDALNKEEYSDPTETINGVVATLNEYVGEAAQFDDITQLCLLYKGIE